MSVDSNTSPPTGTVVWSNPGDGSGVANIHIADWSKGRTAPETRHLPKVLSFLGSDHRPQHEVLGAQLKRHRETLGWTRALKIRLTGPTLLDALGSVVAVSAAGVFL